MSSPKPLPLDTFETINKIEQATNCHTHKAAIISTISLFHGVQTQLTQPLIVTFGAQKAVCFSALFAKSIVVTGYKRSGL